MANKCYCDSWKSENREKLVHDGNNDCRSNACKNTFVIENKKRAQETAIASCTLSTENKAALTKSQKVIKQK